MTLDPFKSWRRIAESATRERPRRKRPQRGAPQRRPEPGAEAHALVDRLLAGEPPFRKADWSRAESIARSPAFLHLVESLVRRQAERPNNLGYLAIGCSEAVLSKLSAARDVIEGRVSLDLEAKVTAMSMVQKEARALAEHLTAAAEIAERLYEGPPPLDPERDVQAAAKSVLAGGSPKMLYALWPLVRVGAFPYVLRETADFVRIFSDCLVGEENRTLAGLFLEWQRFGRRGGAADAFGRLRGALARVLGECLPPNVPGRFTTIAELLTVAGLPTTPANARRLLTRH